MDSIQEKLNILGWDENKLARHLNTLIARRERDRERNRQYFLKNKIRVYEAHRKWRQEHPEYTALKRERMRKKPINEQVQ